MVSYFVCWLVCLFVVYSDFPTAGWALPSPSVYSIPDVLLAKRGVQKRKFWVLISQCVSFGENT